MTAEIRIPLGLQTSKKHQYTGFITALSVHLSKYLILTKIKVLSKLGEV